MTGEIAVIFTSQRTDDDTTGYADAAQAMERLAREQPGFVAIESARDAGGFGITVSTWADEAAALAWRANAEHSLVRDEGRARWYTRYTVTVARVERGYAWERPLSQDASPAQ